MIQEQTTLNVVDNSDTHHVVCIRVLDGLHRRYASVSGIIKTTIKETIPCGKVKKSDVLETVMVRTRKNVRRPDDSVIRFDGNACVLLNSNGRRPIGMHISRPVARKPRSEKFMKIISLTPEIL